MSPSSLGTVPGEPTNVGSDCSPQGTQVQTPSLRWDFDEIKFTNQEGITCKHELIHGIRIITVSPSPNLINSDRLGIVCVAPHDNEIGRMVEVSENGTRYFDSEQEIFSAALASVNQLGCEIKIIVDLNEGLVPPGRRGPNTCELVDPNRQVGICIALLQTSEQTYFDDSTCAQKHDGHEQIASKTNLLVEVIINNFPGFMFCGIHANKPHSLPLNEQPSTNYDDVAYLYIYHKLFNDVDKQSAWLQNVLDWKDLALSECTRIVGNECQIATQDYLRADNEPPLDGQVDQTGSVHTVDGANIIIGPKEDGSFANELVSLEGTAVDIELPANFVTPKQRATFLTKMFTHLGGLIDLDRQETLCISRRGRRDRNDVLTRSLSFSLDGY